MTKKFAFIIFILLHFQSGKILANYEKTDSMCMHKIEFNTGICSYSSIDELYSFKEYTGSDMSFELQYTYHALKTMQNVNINYTSIERMPLNLTIPGNFIAADDRYRKLVSLIVELNYGYLRKIWTNKLDVFAGASFFNSFNMSFASYYVPELMISSIAPGLYFEKKYNPHAFKLQFSVPLISITLRNNYSTARPQNYEKSDDIKYVRDNIQVQFPDKLFVVYTKIGYEYALRNRLNLSTQYTFVYVNNTFPRQLTSVKGNYTIGISYKF